MFREQHSIPSLRRIDTNTRMLVKPEEMPELSKKRIQIKRSNFDEDKLKSELVQKEIDWERVADRNLKVQDAAKCKLKY